MTTNLKILQEAIYPTAYNGHVWPPFGPLRWLLSRFGIHAYRRRPDSDYTEGRLWPVAGCTMIGLCRLKAFADSIEHIVAAKIPGAVVECGVWRGGALIWAAACLREFGDKRRIIGLDSFRGLKLPDKEDGFDTLFAAPELSVSLQEVAANINRFGFADDIDLIQGWVQDTTLRWNTPISCLRIDVDHYDAVKMCLERLWPHLSVGGHLHIDDYSLVGAMRAADEFREKARPFTERVIDYTGRLWIKGA
jgi:O-methyltransferase